MVAIWYGDSLIVRKYKKRHTKKLKGRKQRQLATKSPVEKTKIKSMFRFFGKVIAALSILLNFYLAYLVLLPHISITYSTHILPETEMALPIKITNNGHLTIKNLWGKFTGNIDFDELHGKYRNNESKISISKELQSGKSIEYVYESIVIIGKPSRGTIAVEITYQLPLLKTTFKEKETFHIYKDKFDQIRWITR